MCGSSEAQMGRDLGLQRPPRKGSSRDQRGGVKKDRGDRQINRREPQYRNRLIGAINGLPPRATISSDGAGPAAAPVRKERGGAKGEG